MRHSILELWRDTYFDVIDEWGQRYEHGHQEIRIKMKIKDTNIYNTVGFCIKKTMVKSVVYLLFSYQIWYKMWHSRLTIYIETILLIQWHFAKLNLLTVNPRVETRISHTATNRNCAVSLVRKKNSRTEGRGKLISRWLYFR